MTNSRQENKFWTHYPLTFVIGVPVRNDSTHSSYPHKFIIPTNLQNLSKEPNQNHPSVLVNQERGHDKLVSVFVDATSLQRVEERT